MRPDRLDAEALARELLHQLEALGEATAVELQLRLARLSPAGALKALLASSEQPFEQASDEDARVAMNLAVIELAQRTRAERAACLRGEHVREDGAIYSETTIGSDGVSTTRRYQRCLRRCGAELPLAGDEAAQRAGLTGTWRVGPLEVEGGESFRGFTPTPDP